MDRRALGRRRARRMRKPQGDQRVGSGVEIGEHRRPPCRARLERVDAQVERRARGERRALLRPLVAEGAAKCGVEPFRIIAGDMRRRVGEVGGREPRRARRRSAAAGAKRAPSASLRDRLGVEPALAPEHAEQRSRAAFVAHQIGARGPAAQRVVDEAGDRGAVAGAGEAVREAPVLERIGGGTALGLDVGEHLDGGGQRPARAAASSAAEQRMRTMKMTHMTTARAAPTPNSGRAPTSVAGHVHVGVGKPRQTRRSRPARRTDVGVRAS